MGAGWLDDFDVENGRTLARSTPGGVGGYGGIIWPIGTLWPMAYLFSVAPGMTMNSTFVPERVKH